MWHLKPACLVAGVLMLSVIGCDSRDNSTNPPPTPPKTPPPSPTASIHKTVAVNPEFASLWDRRLS